MLDEILGNESELPLQNHTVDTAGFTEVDFALFSLLGRGFWPRLRDIGDQYLYRMKDMDTYLHVQPLLKATIDEKLILSGYDEMLRVAGSLQLGFVTASLFISKLQARPQQNMLTRVLQEYGKLEKTIFILRYIQDPVFRRIINAQLNKGEQLHGLRQFVHFANEGKIRSHLEEAQINEASCLNLGRDVHDTSLSWAQAAGGAIASARDVDRWMRAVFEGHVVPPKQQAEWMALVSMNPGKNSGKPITDVSIDNPSGYSLGLAKAILSGSLGAQWFYHGMSLGYRTLYGWFEKENLMITLQTNSQPAEEADKLNVLLQTIYQIVESQVK